MAESRKLSDLEDREGVSGTYQFTNLDDIINNFLVAYIGQDKIMTKVPRHEVAFWAQRTVQEFNYDMLPSEKALEFELGPNKKLKLPSDYVSITKIYSVDNNGNERILYRSRLGSPSQAVIQDEEYDPVFDFNGNIITADDSEATKRFQNPVGNDEIRNVAENYYNSNGSDYNYNYFNDSYYGRQWGANTQELNGNGTYLIDNVAGLIIFDYKAYEGQLITVKYVSDGLGTNGDLTTVLIPKFAEDAVYASILYNLSKLRPSAAGAAALYKQEAKAKMNTAKIRLMNINYQEMAQIFRGKNKWIKQ